MIHRQAGEAHIEERCGTTEAMVGRDEGRIVCLRRGEEVKRAAAATRPRLIFSRRVSDRKERQEILIGFSRRATLSIHFFLPVPIFTSPSSHDSETFVLASSR